MTPCEYVMKQKRIQHTDIHTYYTIIYLLKEPFFTIYQKSNVLKLEVGFLSMLQYSGKSFDKSFVKKVQGGRETRRKRDFLQLFSPQKVFPLHESP